MAQQDLLEEDLFAGVTLPPSKSRKDRTLAAAFMDEAALKATHAFKTISEAAGMLSLPQHVLRFWESKFNQIKPLKLKGGRRYYRPQDIDTLITIKHLLYKQGYTIKGAKKALNTAKKQQEPLMSSDMPRMTKPKKPAPTLDDTPLFQSLAAPAPVAAEPAAPEPAKQEMKAIYDELLQLKDMLRGLPALQ